ncbi:AMP-binding protein, partial [Frankia canadensis]|uniref:AMP-binding protein n=1 Tax=Frankia canadensis TaxID=1836972 RepID=UPI001056B363
WSSLTARGLDHDGPALLTPSRQWTGREVLALAAGVQAWLAELDLPRGTVIPALLSDTTICVPVFVAAAGVGRPIAPLGPRLTVAELASAVSRLGSPVIIAEPAHAELAGRVAEAAGVRAAVLSDPLPSAAPGELPPSLAGEPAPGPDDTAIVLHTSGTTGLPKAVHYRQRP